MADARSQEEEDLTFTSSDGTGSSGAVQGTAPVSPDMLPHVGGSQNVNRLQEGFMREYFQMEAVHQQLLLEQLRGVLPLDR